MFSQETAACKFSRCLAVLAKSPRSFMQRSQELSCQPVMRSFLTPVLLIISALSFAQQNEKISLLLQVQPELTFHKNNYAEEWVEKKNVSTFNLGLSASVQYRLSEAVFIDIGLGYISRKINATVFLTQSRLPPPYYDSTAILFTPNSTTSKTLQIPVGIGYYFIKTKRASLFFKTVYVPNFILATKYKAGNFPAFKKHEWQGHSLNIGLGCDYSLTRKVILTNALTFSVINTVARDPYIYGKDRNAIALAHRYLQLSSGILMKL